MDVPELIPLEEYDAKQARLDASISWLLTRAFGSNIPPGLKEPFYIDKQQRICLRPAVINGLTSSDIYCRACRHIFRETTMIWKGHMSVMQALSRKGIYVMDPSQSAVTETVLMQTTPFNQDAHLSLVDALMTAYSLENVTVERIVQAVRKFANFNASSELPYDTEDAILFWLNKVCSTVRQRLERQHKFTEDQENIHRPRSKASTESPSIPMMDDLLKDLNDGCCLAVVISFYCPIALRLHDIALSDSLGIADSMFNLQLIIEFCTTHLPAKTMHLTMNDLFYTSDMIKPHLLAFLAEIFFWFEIKKADCVQDVSKSALVNSSNNMQHSEGDLSPSKKVKTPTAPISNATKKSFHDTSTLQSLNSTSTPDLFNNPGHAMPTTRQPLLPKRLQDRKGSASETYKYNARVRRSRSFTSLGDRELKLHQSLRAWEDGDGSAGAATDAQHDTVSGGGARGQRSPMRQAVISNPRSSSNPHGSRISQQSSTLTNVSNNLLLSNVSIDDNDSELSLDLSTDTSVTISGLEDTPRTLSSRLVNDGDMELQSVTSTTTPRSQAVDNSGTSRENNHQHERLYPAQVRPSKEKINNGYSKDFESGESKLQKKSPVSPTKSNKLSIFQSVNNDTGDDSPSDSEYLTPSLESAPLPGEHQQLQQQFSPKQKPLAFFVDTNSSLRNSSSAPKSPPVRCSQSFVVDGQEYTADSARAAGIPVVESNEYRPVVAGAGASPRRQWGKPKPLDSPRSSDGGSDQELRKIRADSRDKESPGKQHGNGQSFFVTENGEMLPNRPDSLNIKMGDSSNQNSGSDISIQHSSRDAPSPKTSFAEISKKTNDDGSFISSNPQVSKSNPQTNLSLKEQFEKARIARTSKKTTTFAALPNQTTWQQTAKKKTGQSPYEESPPEEVIAEGFSVAPGSELVDVRMQLEERRKQIEREKRKTEMQWNRQRQNVGKQAFMQVINKNKPEEPSSSKLVSNKTTFVPKTIPENKEVSPSIESQSSVGSSNNTRISSNTGNNKPSSVNRMSPSRNKVSRSHSERIPASQRTAQTALRSKPLASEAEDRLQEIMQRLETIEMTSPGSNNKKLSNHNDSDESQNSTSNMRVLMEQDSLSNINDANNQSRSNSRTSGCVNQGNSKKVMSTSGEGKKPFSREDIQSKIDGVKQRWFGDGVENRGNTPPRGVPGQPTGMSHSSDEPLNATTTRQSSHAQALPTQRMSQSLEGQKGYSSSLDKLNTSLSELQGEIMRLSLAQDQIKCMVKDDGTTRTGSESDLSSQPSQPQQEKFYLYPREGDAGETAGGVHGAAKSPQTAVAAPVHQPAPVQPVTQPQMNTQLPSVGPSHIPATGPYHPAAHQQLPPGGLYGVPGQYPTAGGYVGPPPSMVAPAYAPGIPGYSHHQPSPYSHPHHHPAASPQHPYMLPPGVPPVPYHQSPASPWETPPHGYHPPPGAVPPHSTHNTNIPNSNPVMQGYYGAHTGTLQGSPAGGGSGGYSQPSHHTQPTPTTSQSPPQSHHQQQHPPPPVSSYHSTPSHSQRQSPARHHSPSPEKVVRSILPSPATSDTGSHRSDRTSPTKSISSVAMPLNPAEFEMEVSRSSRPADGARADQEEDIETGEPEGFFIAFDSPTPVKPKPQLGRDRKKEPETLQQQEQEQNNKINGQQQQHNQEQVEAPAGMEQRLAPQSPPITVGAGAGAGAGARHSPLLQNVCESEGTSPRSASPCAEKFVVGTDHEETDMSEVEQRKAKFMAIQNKRREEEVWKKRKLEEERMKKNDEQKLKEDMIERKKIEEKQRRDQIFQDYLKRKELREEDQELSRAGMAPVPKRNKSKTKVVARPKSQPPNNLDMDKYSASSHSSQEDLARTRGCSPSERSRKGLSVHESPQRKRDMLFSGNGGGGSTGAGIDNPDSSGGSLAYGGLTHRRPPTPDKGRLPPGLGDQANNNTDYSGPKLFKKPSAKSNKPVMNQAVSHVLAGTVNNELKNKVLESLNQADCNHFLILFRDHSMQYRGLYAYNPETEEISKVAGVGPKQITSKMVDGFYKYNSGAKKFSQITTTKHMSATIDGITIASSFWQKKKVEKKPPTGQY